MNRNAIASNVRHLRDARHWSQEELALMSGVDVRTVQRAEAGRPLSVDTLKALAAAFETTIEALQVSEEEIAVAVEEFNKSYKIIEMHVLSRSSELGEIVGGSHALFLHKIGDLTEDQLDDIAELEELLRDYLDIWSDMEPTGRREAEKTLFTFLASMVRSDMSISFGTENMAMRAGNGQPFRMPVLYIAVSKGQVPMLAVVRPKNMPINFVI